MTASGIPEYYSDLYGDNTISWVPPVTNYLFAENISKRGINDRDFRWEEVVIDLTQVQSGAILDFTMPDYYMLQFTPDIGWHDTLAMFGETTDTSIHNPHLQNIGPFSISNGSLNDNSDNSVDVTLTVDQMEKAIIDGYPKYLWRAVPWADGNPGLGGLPSAFEWVSSADQLKFVVDSIVKETNKSTQTISGTKGPRVNITIESDNNPTVFIEQSSTSWKVIFSIDRPNVKFTIVATDSGGTAITKYFVDLSYDLSTQISLHAWNAFDSFALMASLTRLPGENNASLKDRTIDAFKYKGGTHYSGLIAGLNRELGLRRKDTALTLRRKRSDSNSIFEQSIEIETFYNRMSIVASSFVIYDELSSIDSYTNSISLNKRINNILSIKTIGNQEIKPIYWEVDNKETSISGNLVKIDPAYSGIVKVTYSYKEDISFETYPNIASLCDAINNIQNPNGYNILTCTLDGSLTGSEKSKNVYKTYVAITTDSAATIGWSPVGLFSVSDKNFKWSFVSDSSTFFDSDFYKYVTELKSSTNIEWGFVIADEDYWDAFDAEWYGKDSLPLALDIKLSKYVLSIPASTHVPVFDAYEALRMNYYYDKKLITNVGFPQAAFKSGVGYKKDCIVGFTNKVITSSESKINLNPISLNYNDVVKFDQSIDDILVDL